MELKQYWAVIAKWMWLIVLATGIAAAFSFLATIQVPKVYQASTTLLVGQTIQNPNPNAQDIFTSQQLAQTYAQIALTEPVLQGVVEALGLKISTDQLRAQASASSVQGTQLIELRYVDTDPRRAQAIANEMAHQVVLQGPTARDQVDPGRREFIQKQVDDIQRKIEEAQQKIDDLQRSVSVTGSAREIADRQQQISTLQSQQSQWQLTYANLIGILAPLSPNYLTIIEPAKLPRAPIGPNVTTNILLAAIVGMLLSVGAAFLIEYIDDTVKTADDVTQSLKLPMLGSIARIAGDDPDEKMVAVKSPRSVHTEAYRLLRTNIQVADVDKPIKTLLVTSPSPIEGKSTTAANLAVVMAQAGLHVVLVDADMRRPSQHKLFHLANNVGLTNILYQPTPVVEGLTHFPGIENLVVITTGQIPPNPTELLGSKRMQGLIQWLKGQADIVIFDTPPCLSLADVAVLVRQVDGVLLVLDAGHTRRDTAIRTKEAVERAGGHILGVALNRVAARESSYYYYYSDEGRQRKDRSSRTGTPLTNGLSRLMQRPLRNHDGE